MSLIIICVLIRYFQNIVDSIMDTEAEDSCETDLEDEVDKEIKEEEIVIILCIYSLIKSIKLHVISIYITATTIVFVQVNSIHRGKVTKPRKTLVFLIVSE